ncbi:peptidyl-prolyl cis-trans isomerase B [mine drainage metagenome]|uniref:Peptidyl-prolyl cis-trans isomerase B n=1 Tax=mine drainage metagenome TaxID=410659 RepID=A0A1J5PZC2_9ZZZZ
MSSQPPVRRNGGSTKRPKGPKVQTKVEPNPTFSRGTIGVLIALIAIAGLAISIGLGGFSSASKPLATATPSASATPAASTSKAPAGTVQCTYTKDTTTGGKFVGLPNATVTPGTKTATVTTNLGKIVFELSAKTPCTENSFAFLASKKFFDATPCHRLLNAVGFTALQCGDPTGTGTGGPGYKFADENLTGATYPRGTVAMANAGPGTNGSQFFFVYKDSKFGPNYTPFGRVISGLNVLDAIAANGTSNGSTDGAPKKPVTINTLTVN